MSPKLSDVYPPVTDLPPIPRQTETASEQHRSPQLPTEIILGGIVAGVAGVLMLTVLPSKRKKTKIFSHNPKLKLIPKYELQLLSYFDFRLCLTFLISFS